MADPDESFRDPGDRSPDAGAQVPFPSSPERLQEPEQPLILDPEFHQSVWKPWHSDDGPDTAEDKVSQHGTTRLRSTRQRRWLGWLSVTGGIVVLLVALVLPSMIRPTLSELDPPLVENMPTLPSFSWSAEGAEHCPQAMDEDHVIVYDSFRVWSLDLRSGGTAWSVMLPTPIGQVTCLPGVDLIAVTSDTGPEDAHDFTLLNGTTGEQEEVLPATGTTHVIPLGDHVGLVDPNNVLSMVSRNRLDTPLWTRELKGVAPNAPVFVRPLDEDIVQLFYESSESVGGFESTVLSLRDGENPAWFTPGSPSRWYYEMVDGVVMRIGDQENSDSLTALDSDGETLWSDDAKYPSIAGERLYLFEFDGSAYASRVFEADPRTGMALNDNAFTGEFMYAQATRQGYLAVMQREAAILLDQDLRPATTVEGESVRFLLEGTDQLFLAMDMDPSDMVEKIRLTAVATDDLSVLWTLDLEEDQRVERVGQHLIVTDYMGNTIQGLWSSL